MLVARGRLTERERFAALNSLLSEPSASWGRLMTLMISWPAEHRLADALAAAEAAAGRWRPHERALTGAVDQQIIGGHFSPALRLLRSLDFIAHWPLRERRPLSGMIELGGVRELCSLVTRYHYKEDVVSLLPHTEGLTCLYLGSSVVGTRGAVALAGCASLSGLISLSLHGNSIGDEGAEALLASPYLRGLRYLNVHGNGLSHSTLERLRQAPAWQGATVIG